MSVLPETPATPVTEPTQPEVSAPPASQGEHMIPKTRLDEEIAKRKALEGQLQELEQLKAEKKKQEEAALSETEKLQKRAAEAEAKAAKIETENNQTKAALKAGLPVEWADRLKGATYDEYLADATELAKTLPQLKTAPKVPPTNPGKTETVDKVAETRHWLRGGSSNPFDLNTAKEKGGGVFGT